MPQNLSELRESPVDLFEIEMNVRDFFNCLKILNSNNVKTKCLDARKHLENCRILVRNLIIIQDNVFIKDNVEFFNKMNDNLGRLDKRLEEYEKDIEQLEMNEINRSMTLDDSIRTRKYVNLLIKCMDGLILIPILKSILDYKKNELSEELFIYSIFKQMYSSSESLGAETAEKQKRFSGGVEYVETHDDKKYLPDAVDLKQEDPVKKAEDYFSGNLDYNEPTENISEEETPEN